MKAEVCAQLQDWKNVVTTLRRLMDVETDTDRKAERALGIGRIFSDVYRDHRRASGWYKRAVDLSPSRMDAVRAFCSEVAKLDDETVPVEQVRDAIDRGIEAQREALRIDPLRHDAYFMLKDLFGVIGATDAELRVLRVLDWLGRGDGALKEEMERLESRRNVDWRRDLDQELKQRYVVSRREFGPGRELFDALSHVITELTSSPIIAGVPRLSRRSFRLWQDEYQALRVQMGCDEAEIWNGGRLVDQIEARYLPQSALVVPTSYLERTFTAWDRMELCYELESLGSGRLLLERPGVEAVDACSRIMVDDSRSVSLSDSGKMSVAGLRRAVDKAKRLPRRHQAILESYRDSSQDILAELLGLQAGVEETRLRVGYVACQDIRVALDFAVFGTSEQAKVAHRSGGTGAGLVSTPHGLNLLEYSIGEKSIELHRILTTGRESR